MSATTTAAPCSLLIGREAAPSPLPARAFDQTWSPTSEDIANALVADEFLLYYQPIFDSDTLDVVAYESLIRWNHPTRGMIPPQQFIAAAEQNGAIHRLGLWVVRRACRDLASLHSRYVGVNVSPMQLRSATFAAQFAEILQAERVDRAQITVEITESVALHDDTVERWNLDEIRRGGNYLAIDDFGTGFASYDYLQQFPFNVVKIDKSFVRDVATCSESVQIVKDICEIGRRQDLVIVAEGVETQEQLDVLKRLGCTRVQGYLLGRPAPLAALVSRRG